MTFFDTAHRFFRSLHGSAPTRWITSKKKLQQLVKILEAFLYQAKNVKADAWLESIGLIREFIKDAKNNVLRDGAAPAYSYLEGLMGDLMAISALAPFCMGSDLCIGGTRFDHWNRAKMSRFVLYALTWNGSKKTDVRKPSKSDVQSAIDRMGTSGSTNTYGANLGPLFGVQINAMCESIIEGKTLVVLTPAQCLQRLQAQYVVPLNTVVKYNISEPRASNYVSPVELNKRNPVTPLSTPRGGVPRKYQVSKQLVYLPQSVPTPFNYECNSLYLERQIAGA